MKLLKEKQQEIGVTIWVEIRKIDSIINTLLKLRKVNYPRTSLGTFKSRLSSKTIPVKHSYLMALKKLSVTALSQQFPVFRSFVFRKKFSKFSILLFQSFQTNHKF